VRYRKCRVKDCFLNVYCKDLCHKHYERVQRNGDIKLRHPKGKKNWRWNNGVSEYPNHSLLKRNRLIKMKLLNWKCEICGRRAVVAFHKDGNKANQDIENLMCVCTRCFGLLIRRVKEMSKFLSTSKEYKHAYYELNRKKYQAYTKERHRLYYVPTKLFCITKQPDYRHQYYMENRDRILASRRSS